jgi:hypothetical protein
MRSLHSLLQRMRWLGSASLAIGMSACALLPAGLRSDADGSAATAGPLSLNQPASDELDCGFGRADCSDWFAVEVPGTGELQLRVAIAADAASEGAMTLRIHAAEPTDPPLAARQCRSAEPCELARHVASGRHLVQLEADPGVRASYTLLARLRTAGQPGPATESSGAEPATTRPVPAQIIEFEGRAGGPRTVVLDLGEADGMRAGLQGRLLRDGEIVAEIEIREVYPDGSRARILDDTAGHVSGANGAELDLPIEEGH